MPFVYVDAAQAAHDKWVATTMGPRAVWELRYVDRTADKMTPLRANSVFCQLRQQGVSLEKRLKDVRVKRSMVLVMRSLGIEQPVHAASPNECAAKPPEYGRVPQEVSVAK
jgi:hypothetical protein